MIKYGFFNSLLGDRMYGADDVSEFFKGVLSDGIFKGYADELKVVPTGELSINVKSGKALINSKYLTNTDQTLIEITEAENNRTDCIVAFCDMVNRICGLKVVQGSSNDNAAQSLTYKSIVLATISVRANSSEILDTDITDLRSQSWVNLTALQSAIQQVETRFFQTDISYHSGNQYYYINISSTGYDPSNCTGLSVFVNGVKLEEYYYSYEASTHRLVFNLGAYWNYILSYASTQSINVVYLKNNNSYS